MKLCQVSILSSLFAQIGIVSAFSPLGFTSPHPLARTVQQTKALVVVETPTTSTTSLFQFAADAITVAGAVHSLSGQTVVVKYGGNAMTSPELAKGFCEDIASLQKLGVKVVVVHGGGPQIKSMLEKVGVDSRLP